MAALQAKLTLTQFNSAPLTLIGVVVILMFRVLVVQTKLKNLTVSANTNNPFVSHTIPKRHGTMVQGSIYVTTASQNKYIYCTCVITNLTSRSRMDRFD